MSETLHAWHIVDWETHNEVNSSCREWEPGQIKKKGGLRYVRTYCLGPKGDNTAYAEAAIHSADHFGPEAWCTAYAVFEKFREITGRLDVESRGWLVGKGRKPLSARMLVELTKFTPDQLHLGTQVLSHPDVGWLEYAELPWAEAVSDGRGNPRAPADISDPSRSEEEKKGTEQKETEKEVPAETAVEDSTAFDAEVKLNPTAYAALLIKVLQVSRHDLKQNRADATTFKKLARHINAGHLGTPEVVAEGWLRKARKIGHEPELVQKNQTARVFMSEFKEVLEAAGEKWGQGLD